MFNDSRDFLSGTDGSNWCLNFSGCFYDPMTSRFLTSFFSITGVSLLVHLP